jgi:hypothetical protein
MLIYRYIEEIKFIMHEKRKVEESETNDLRMIRH